MVRFSMPDALKRSAAAWPIAVTAVVLTATRGRVSLDLPTDSTVNTAGVSGSGGEGANTSGPACGGHRCAATQICCILDGTCIDPTIAATSCTKLTVLPRGALPGREPVARMPTVRRLSSASPLWAVSALGLVSSKTTAARARADHGTGAMVSANIGFRLVRMPRGGL
jgi:hypothetical protein